jgi:signal transduction histidine kinase
MKPESPVKSTAGVTALSVVLVAIIGWIDYLTGEFSLAVFFLGPICFTTWRAGRKAGYTIAGLSVAAWFAGDVVMWHNRHPLMPYWNAAILGAIYGIVVYLLWSLHQLQMELEARVAQRTAALVDANAELQAMERELMEITERERHRIGEDLHDSLGQKLTAASLTSNALILALETAQPDLKGTADYLGQQLRDAIAETRTLSHGLAPVSVEADGLMHALRALAESTRQAAKLRCVLECPAPVGVDAPAQAVQLYRIAQEAVNNAVKHAGASEIRIGLERQGDAVLMEVEDDGAGMPESAKAGHGIGLRVMHHRAQIIGGTLEIGPSPAGGTRITCRTPSIS